MTSLFLTDTFIASWDNKISKHRCYHVGKTQGEHQQVYENLKKTHRPITVSGTKDTFAIPYYCSVWELNDGRYWETRHGIPGTEFQKVFDNAKKRSVRPVFIDGFGNQGNALFNSIWEKENGYTWNAEFGIKERDYQSKFDQRCREGLRLISSSPYVEDNQIKYVTVWDKSPSNGWIARHGLTLTQFNIETDQNNAKGYTLYWAKSVRFNRKESFTAIWVKMKDATSATRQAIDKKSLGEYHQEFTQQNLKIRMLSNTHLGEQYDELLAFTIQQQSESLWCWAACASSIAAYYGIFKSQCELVSWDFGILGNNLSLNCCSPEQDCNNGGDLHRILNRINLSRGKTSNMLSFSYIQAELRANRPIGIYIIWNTGGHHIMVITGCQMGKFIRIADPAQGREYWTTYANMINKSSFTWDHSILTKKPV